MLTIMKTKKYILFALAVLGLTTSCMEGSWDAPSAEAGMSAYGNQDIKATNLKTIAEVKALFATEINASSLKQVTQPMQIMGIVTGNDEGGNIYNALYIQDNTGAIAISIGQGGLYGPFAVGQTVLVELNGLYVGSYRKQPQIGTIYIKEEGATPQVGRLTRYEWQNHYKLVPAVDGLIVAPIEAKFNLNKLDIDQDCAKLITLRGVTIAEANGTAVFAPSNDPSVRLTANCANRTIVGVSDVLLRTSTYADFANQPLPTGRVDITGVATRFDNDWQFLMRTIKDIQPTTLADDDVPPTSKPTGSGTQTDPYNVAGIIEATKNLASGATTTKEYYAKGYVSKVGSFNEKFNSLSYYISDDKDGDMNSFYVYSGQGLGNTNFSSASDLKVGDEVVVYGKVTNYNGTIEFQSQNYIVTLNGQGSDGNGDNGQGTETNVTNAVDGATLTLTNTTVTASDNTITIDLSAQGWSDAVEVTSLTASDGTTINFSKGDGSNSPKYYAATKGIRMYAKNAITITGASKAIAKVVLGCDSYNGTDYVGNTTLYGSATGNAMTIVNEHSSASGGTQLRVKTITITYAN